MALIDQYKAFIIDLDGVLYLINDPIDGSVEAIRELQSAGKPFVFLTNNSSSTPAMYTEKLKFMGLEISEDQVVTSSQALAWFIRDNYETCGKKVLLLGGRGLYDELSSIGLQVVDEDGGDSADFVVVGWDREFSYGRLKAAVIAVRKGAHFMASNTDASYPTPDGLWPGAGAMVAAVSTGSEAEPFVAGKPNRLMVELALKRMGAKAEEALLIGDRIETDILAGANSNVDTLLVMTGVSTIDDIERQGIAPTHIRDSLKGVLDT
ncbi:MAG: HAD-IIA family hydrolase [Actinobacteria bacterium]|nr:HAD-IIA family hydrolase [Actinomycetota bacterium]